MKTMNLWISFIVLCAIKCPEANGKTVKESEISNKGGTVPSDAGLSTKKSNDGATNLLPSYSNGWIMTSSNEDIPSVINTLTAHKIIHSISIAIATDIVFSDTYQQSDTLKSNLLMQTVKSYSSKTYHENIPSSEVTSRLPILATPVIYSTEALFSTKAQNLTNSKEATFVQTSLIPEVSASETYHRSSGFQQITTDSATEKPVVPVTVKHFKQEDQSLETSINMFSHSFSMDIKDAEHLGTSTFIGSSDSVSAKSSNGAAQYQSFTAKPSIVLSSSRSDVITLPHKDDDSLIAKTSESNKPAWTTPPIVIETESSFNSMERSRSPTMVDMSTSIQSPSPTKVFTVNQASVINTPTSVITVPTTQYESKSTTSPPRTTTKKEKPDHNEVIRDTTTTKRTTLTTFLSKKSTATTKVPPKKTITIPFTKPTEKTSNFPVKPTVAWLPPLYITILLQMSWKEFCPKEADFKISMAKILEKKTGLNIGKEQIFIKSRNCKINDKSRKTRSSEIAIHFYVLDTKGKYSYKLTRTLVLIVEDEGFNSKDTPFYNKILGFKIHGVVKGTGQSIEQPQRKPGIGAGVVAGIALGSLVVACLFAFVILQLILLRKRRNVKKMRYSYEASRPSIEVNSMAESIHMSSLAGSPNGSKYAYVNPALCVDEKDYTSNPLSMAELAHMKDDYEAMEDEFLMLPNNMPKLSEIPAGAEYKNRYANVIPNPETRVPLDCIQGEENSDYINANYLRGMGGVLGCYIATQAPLEATTTDFWRMVWEEETGVIVMVTDLEEHGIAKCYEYWPNTTGGDTIRIFGDFEIIQQKRSVKQEWIHSELHIKHLEKNVIRNVHHFWLTAWPQHGVPENIGSILRFLLEVKPHIEESIGPPIVHCSPGTGRTGTLIALDICMHQFDIDLAADVLNTVYNMRYDRGGTVQTKEQYYFIYKAIYEYAALLCNPSRASQETDVSSSNEEGEEAEC